MIHVMTDLTIDIQDHYRFVSFCAGRPVNSFDHRLSCLCKAYPGSEDRFFQFIGLSFFVKERRQLRIMENERNLRTMPCNLTVQKRKLIRQLIGISDTFRCSQRSLINSMVGRRKMVSTDRRSTGDFPGYAFFVKSQQFFRMFSILFLQHLHGLFSWNAVFSRNSRTEIKLAQCCSDQKRDRLRMLRKAMLHRSPR